MRRNRSNLSLSRDIKRGSQSDKGNKLMFHNNTRQQIQQYIKQGITVTTDDHSTIVGVVDPCDFKIEPMSYRPGYFITFKRINDINLDFPFVDKDDESNIVFPNEGKIYRSKK